MIIYKVTNLKNEKVYIGQTTGPLSVRWSNHCRKGFILYKAIQKYGKENFLVEQIDRADSPTELDVKEIQWIENFSCTATVGYNLKSGGSKGLHSGETKKKISEKGLGRIHSEETKRKIKVGNTGKVFSKQRKDKISKAKLGKRLSQDRIDAIKAHHASSDYRRYLSDSCNKRYLEHPEIARKISKSLGGKTFKCLETGEIFYTQMEAARAHGVCNTGISAVLNGNRNVAGGKHYEYISEKITP